MVNDTNTLNGALTELGEKMADNLVSMGVTGADASDGLTTLAGKILSIEPSIGGLDLDTAITLSASSTSITVGQSVVFTSKLTASYDDETVTDVDLTGVLTGATVLFEDLNGVVVGSGVTDSTGYATATVSNLAAGSHTIKAIFEGTDNFHYADSSTVSVTVTAQTFDGITISNTNDVISYNNGSSPESTTITAQLTDSGSAVSVGGETVTFKIKQGDTVIETLSDTTDNTGKASVSYEANGIGDCSIVCECNLLTETYVNTLQDCEFADTMTEENNKYTLSGSLLTNDHNSDGWKYNASTLTWIDINNYLVGHGVSVEYTPTEAYSYSDGNAAPIQFYFENSSQTRVYVLQANTFAQIGSSTKTSHNISLNSQYRVEYTSNSVKLYLGDTLIGQNSHSLGTSNIKLRIATASNRYCRLKNFKIKPL